MIDQRKYIRVPPTNFCIRPKNFPCPTQMKYMKKMTKTHEIFFVDVAWEIPVTQMTNEPKVGEDGTICSPVGHTSVVKPGFFTKKKYDAFLLGIDF